MISNIAFDLDGVLVPDYRHIAGLNHQEFYEYTLYAKPMFNPTGIFDIVTARSEKYRAITEKWVKQLTTQPNRLFMKTNQDETPTAYKSRICHDQGYRVFVESDAEIVENMSKANGLQVIHFDEYISKQFDKIAHQGELFNFIK
jgi:FMN phosphatase YigB (HAD superfamily)